MKTDDLKAQGLTEEQINFVMGENGKDLKALQEENATLKATNLQLENDKKVITKEKEDKEKAYNDLQKNTISKEEYEQKIKEIETNSKKEQEDYIYENLLNTVLNDAKVRKDEKTRQAFISFLDREKIKISEDKKSLIGAKEQIEPYKKEIPHFFETQVDGNPPTEPEGNGGKGDGGAEISTGSNFAKRNNAEDKAEKSEFFK